MTKKAFILSFLGGFLSLSIEVIYIRLFSFQLCSVPQAFSLALAIFLIGIALGAFVGKEICYKGKASINTIGIIFLLASLFDIFAIYILIAHIEHFELAFLILCILGSAFLRGIIFPIVHHLGTETIKTGAAISNVYFANVIGCTIAPVLIGFYLFDIFTTQQVYLLVISITLFVATFCLSKIIFKIIAGLLTVIVLSSIFLIPETLISSLAQKKDLQLETLIENKHGFIQVYKNGNNEHLVLGNNVYDGKLNVDLLNNSNMIDRAYLIPVIAPKIKNILVIGLSTGSWVEVLSAMPNVEKITVVELNPAYVEFAKFYPEMARLLKDPRIEIIADDGRRWLNRHKNTKFDFILMNTTFHWRNYAANLLSKEFLTLTKKHLNSDGFIFFNTTSSGDAFYTAKSVFPYVYAYKNMALASLQPFEVFNQEQVSNAFKTLRWNHNGDFIFKTPLELEQATKKMLETPFLNYKQIDFSVLKRKPEIITDYNMITEYKYGLLSSTKE